MVLAQSIAAAVLCLAHTVTSLPASDTVAANARHEVVTVDPEILARAVALNLTEVPPSSHGDVAQVKRAVVGTENRALWTDRNFPYSAIGRVSWETGKVCTGTLVGPQHVLTAASCVAPTGTWMSFQPAFASGETYPSSNVSRSLLPPIPTIDCYEDDYAVLVLMDTLGNDRGYFGAKVFNYKEQMNKANWYHMGYPSDLGNFLQPYRQGQISVLDFTPPPRGRCTIIHGALTTDADMSVGQIGGPLWLGPEWDPDGNRYVTAVASRVESSYSVFSAGVLSRGDIVNFVYAAREYTY